MNQSQETLHAVTGPENLSILDNADSFLTDMCLDEDLTYFDKAFTSLIDLPEHYEGLSFFNADSERQVGYELSENVERSGVSITPSSQTVEPPYIASLRNCLLSRLYDMGLREARLEDITQDLQVFFTADRVERFTRLYFDNWHKNGPILHRPSFSSSTTRISLLLAVTFFGAMYSNNPQEYRIAASLLDTAELAIFSTPPFSCTATIAKKLNDLGTAPNKADAWGDFEDLQAAYLICTVQYWAGDQSAINRVIENRFSDIVQVARKLGLTKIRHTLQDRISEDLWIRKERQVRMMFMIQLLDFAFMFYSNYPCILTFAELRADLPCEFILFESEHPFAEEEFCFSRNVSANDLLGLLFQTSDPVPDARPVKTRMTASLLLDHVGKNRSRIITLQDLYLLVHILCVMSQMRSALFSPLADNQRIYIEIFSEPRLNWNSLIERALHRWHSFWETMRANTAPEQWQAAGMYKNSYNIWRVARILHDKPEIVSQLGQLDIPCADKLAELKVMLSREV